MGQGSPAGVDHIRSQSRVWLEVERSAEIWGDLGGSWLLLGLVGCINRNPDNSHPKAEQSSRAELPVDNRIVYGLWSLLLQPVEDLVICRQV